MASGRIPAPSYRRVYEKGRSAANKYLVLYYRQDALPVRFGVVTSKRLGKANVRNLVKRRLKECFRNLLPCIEPKGEFVIIARQRAVMCSYQRLLAAVKELFKRMDLLE